MTKQSVDIVATIRRHSEEGVAARRSVLRGLERRRRLDVIERLLAAEEYAARLASERIRHRDAGVNQDRTG